MMMRLLSELMLILMRLSLMINLMTLCCMFPHLDNKMSVTNNKMRKVTTLSMKTLLMRIIRHLTLLTNLGAMPDNSE